MTAVRTLARPLLAAGIIASGVNSFRNAEQTATVIAPAVAQVEKAAPEARRYTADRVRIAKILGGAQAAAGLLLATGKLPRLSSAVLISTQAVNTWVEHQASADNSALQTQGLLKNISLLGGVMLATVDTEGKPGLAWRASHLGEQAKRQAHYLGQDVRHKALDAQHTLASANLSLTKGAHDLVAKAQKAVA